MGVINSIKEQINYKKALKRWSKYLNKKNNDINKSILSWIDSDECIFDDSLIELLYNLTSEEHKSEIIGVHRTDDDSAMSICDNGLRLTGHLSSGSLNKDIDMELNISVINNHKNRYINFLDMVTGVFGGCGYRYSGPNCKTGVVLISIPRDKEQKEVLDDSGKNLKPEYVMGYVQAHYRGDKKIEFKYIDREEAVKKFNDFRREIKNFESSLSENSTKNGKNDISRENSSDGEERE